MRAVARRSPLVRGRRQLRERHRAHRVRRVAARRHERRRPARRRRRRQRVARRIGRDLARAGARRRASSIRARTSDTRVARTAASRRRRTPVVAVCNPDLHVARRDRPRPCSPVRRARASRPSARGSATSTASTYPSARSVPSLVDAVGHGLLGLLWPANPFSRRYRELDADPDAARDVDWVSGAAIWLRRRRARRDRRLGRRLLHVRRGRRPVLAARAGRMAHRLRAGRRGRARPGRSAPTATPYRMIVEHHRSLLRFASKRWHGPRRLLLVPGRGLPRGSVRRSRWPCAPCGPRSGEPRVSG